MGLNCTSSQIYHHPYLNVTLFKKEKGRVASEVVIKDLAMLPSCPFLVDPEPATRTLEGAS